MHDVERLFHAWHPTLLRYLVRRLGDRDWAEEVAQETFVRAIDHVPLASERSWLFAVANNIVRDDARRDSRRKRHLALLAGEERGREERLVSSPEPSAMERAESAAVARQALDALAERDRLALLMREEGLDYGEIAEALELSVKSVGTTLARARRRLAEAYDALAADRDGARSSATTGGDANG